MKNFIRYVLIFLLLAYVSQMSGQGWNMVGSGIPGTWGFNDGSYSAVYQGEYYVAHEMSNGIELQKWNGLNWVSYPKIVGGALGLTGLVVSNQGIFIIVGGGNNLISFYEFQGSNWVSKAPPGYVGSSKTAEEINGELWVGGSFSASGGILNIYKYSSGNFISMPGGTVDVIDIHEFQGTTYISDNRNVTSSNPNGLLEFSGSAWSQSAHHFKQGTSTTVNSFEIFDFQNELYVADNRPNFSEVVYKVKADSLEWIDSLHLEIRDWIKYNGSLYLGGRSSGSASSMIWYDGTTFTDVNFVPKYISSFDSLNGELYMVSNANNGSWGNMSFNHVLRTGANNSVLNGRTFLDINSDCQYNIGESTIPNLFFKVGGQTVSSGANGEYSFAFASGTYSVDTAYFPYINAKNVVLQCPLPKSITVGSNQTVNQDIAFSNNVPVDMFTAFSPYSGWSARYGFTELYSIDVINMGNTLMPSASVTVKIPPSVSVSNFSPAPSSLNGNLATFSLSNFMPSQGKRIHFRGQINTANNTLGDTLVWTVSLGTVNNDSDLSDNVDTLYQIVVGAYDPNDKRASASKIGPNTKSIDYHIRFQNTGTDVAHKVTVVDTLDVTLPITNIVIKSASHPYSLSVVNNILIWEFDNIMLPDSSSDYLGSQGYVRFSAGIDPGLGIGDTIENDAEIYFDYQSPVHTNHAKTAIVNDIGLDEGYMVLKALEVYPNPASDRLYLKNTSGEVLVVRMFSVAGKEVLSLDLDPSGVHSLDLDNLPSGVYIINSEAGSYRVIIKD